MQYIFLCLSGAVYIFVFVRCSIYFCICQEQYIFLCLSGLYIFLCLSGQYIFLCLSGAVYISVFVRSSIYFCVCQEQYIFLCLSGAVYISVFVRSSIYFCVCQVSDVPAAEARVHDDYLPCRRLLPGAQVYDARRHQPRPHPARGAGHDPRQQSAKQPKPKLENQYVRLSLCPVTLGIHLTFVPAHAPQLV